VHDVAFRKGRREWTGVAKELVRSHHEHRLATHATAVAFRVLVSLVPLALLGVGLLGALHLRSVWDDSVSPALHAHLAASVAGAFDDTAHRIFARSGAGLLALAVALVVWNTLLAIRAIEHALDEIHASSRRRPLLRGVGVGLVLAVALDLCLVGALLAVVLPPRAVAHGAAHTAVDALRWPVAVALLWLAVGLLVRYAPAEHPQPRWASAGSALVVVGWLVASVVFGFWSSSVANYRSAAGTLTAFLVLTAYVLVLAFVLVVGAQLDETLRRGNARR
jgi:membrane protein